MNTVITTATINIVFDGLIGTFSFLHTDRFKISLLSETW